MELIFAILVALGSYVDPSWTKKELLEKNPEGYKRALMIKENKLYHYNENGIVIIDETGGKN